MPDLFGASQGDRVRRSAGLSDCGAYRYWLRRAWTAGDGCCTFIMLNPSTADALQDDPTIRRCVAFAKRWGYSALHVANLFALRATDPAELLRHPDPVGPSNDAELAACATASRVVCAWGAGARLGRDRRALEILAGVQLWCLGLTAAGHPRHPLYVRADAPLIPFRPKE